MFFTAMLPHKAAARWRAGGVAALLLGLAVETVRASPGVLRLVRPPCGLPRANTQHWIQTQRGASARAQAPGVVRKAHASQGGAQSAASQHALAGGTRCLAVWPVA